MIAAMETMFGMFRVPEQFRQTRLVLGDGLGFKAGR